MEHAMQRARVMRLILAGSIAVMSLPITAAAQAARTQRRTLERARALQVTPYLGMVQSLGSLVADSMVRLRPVGAPVLGTRIALQPAAVWGLEASLGWSPNLIAQSDWKRTVDLTGGVWLASLRNRFQIDVGSDKHATVLSFSPGFGLVHRYGSAWKGMNGTTDAALVLAAGLRYREAELPIAFVVDLESFLTRTGYRDAAGTTYGGHVHSDMVLSLGVTFDLGT
jgi:hypothetical protein